MLVTLTSAILFSPEPLVVRFPGTAQQLYLTSAPEFAKQAIYGLAVGEYEGKEKAFPMQYWLGRDKSSLPSPAARAKKATKEAEEKISQVVSEVIHAAKEKALAGKDKFTELEEAVWARAIEGARGTKQKAKEVIENVEDTGSRVAQKVIFGPTLASLEMISSTARGAKRKVGDAVESVKENVRHGVESVEETGRSIRDSVSGAVGAVNDKVTKTGKKTWDTAARVGETAWELEEGARQRAIDTGHAFWYGLCKTEDMAKLALCRVEESTRRTAATVYQRGAAVIHCVKKEALHPDERKALAGKVEWCQNTAEDYASKASPTVKGAFEGARSATKEGGEKISELDTHGVADWTKGKLSQAGEAGEAVRDKFGDVVDSGKEVLKSKVPSTDTEEGDNLFDNAYRGGVPGKETAEKAQDVVRKAAQGIDVGSFDESSTVSEGAQKAYGRTKDTMGGYFEKGKETLDEVPDKFTSAVESKYSEWREQFEQMPEDVQNLFQKGWGLVDVTQREATGPRTWNRDVTHSFFWVGFQRLLHLGSFCVAFAGSLFSVVQLSSNESKLVQTEIDSRILRISIGSLSVGLGIMIQTWYRRPDLTNQWQVYALGLAFLGFAISSWVLLPRIKKVLIEKDELGKNEAEELKTPGSPLTASEQNETGTEKPSWNPFSTESVTSADTTTWRNNPTAELPEYNYRTARGSEMEVPKSPLRVVRKYWSEKKLWRLETALKITNFLSLAGLTWHWWHLACRLVL